MTTQILLGTLAGILLLSCSTKDSSPKDNPSVKHTTKALDPAANDTILDVASIMDRPEIPVLCYHQIRDWTAGDSKSARDIIVPVNNFKAQMKLLADSGYHTVLPDQLYDYLTRGRPLPPKSFMLTFDDTDDDQYNIAWNEMKKYNFKGVFFIMTVSLNRPKYMTIAQVKELSDSGNVIASHTWDHHKFTDYKTDEDWAKQVEAPRKKIEDITGKPANYFAYPYGLWNQKGIPELKKRGIKAAFILSTHRDSSEPLYTIRRMIASGYWSAPGMYRSMIKTFRMKEE